VVRRENAASTYEAYTSIQPEESPWWSGERMQLQHLNTCSALLAAGGRYHQWLKVTG